MENSVYFIFRFRVIKTDILMYNFFAKSDIMRDFMKEIYIMLTASGTLVAKSIKFYTRAKYNHVSIGIDSQMKVFYSFARRVRYLPLIGGFITEVVDEGLFKKYCDYECIVYSITVDRKAYNKFRRLLNNYISNSKKYKYNLLGFFGVMLNIPFEFKYRRTCAEFVARMLHESGIYTFNKRFSLVRPEEISDIPMLKVIFKGKIKELAELKK